MINYPRRPGQLVVVVAVVPGENISTMGQLKSKIYLAPSVPVCLTFISVWCFGTQPSRHTPQSLSGSI